MSGPISLDALVRDALDTETFASQDAAYEAIERRAAMAAPRALNIGERAKVGFAVALEWNRRFHAEEAFV